ncbi:hypothetical protein ESB00_06995 [Oleiharenicola lentus]|uniref:DUF2017 family protein n=1 Tax=Oleiharenicola lentus TaxID=2508720 RepID=A0A4Q1C9J4_9BACT|nr:hypothetical protein [Oleiharenicola lentus]RXK55628.1 hypothetical protein ESB00_06995 [Oleiharenicola lentus]
MKQVEIRLNISAVAPLLDIIKAAADDLRDTLAVKATFPEHDAEFNETWTQDLMAGQNSDVRELLGLFDSDFFTDGAISIDSENCDSLLRACSALRIRILTRWLAEVSAEILEDEDAPVELIPQELRLPFAAYTFLDQIQKIILEHLSPAGTE